MDNTIWLKDGRILHQVDGSVELIKNLPNKVYTIQEDPRSGELFLEEYADGFQFDFKVYGIENSFINHVIKTITCTTGNLGILLNGAKGTGKTVTAKLLANNIGFPVILITEAYKNLADFISKICCPCTLFFDEYEKIFTKDTKDISILSIMDGVFNSPYRRIFLFTTNNLYVNDNIIGRPSRVRYKKTFGNLSPEIIQEYLNDNLNDKSYISEITQFVDTLAISTIDILKSIVDEINIHNTPLSTFKSFFNVESAKYSWNIKFRSIDADSEHYSVKEFKEELCSIGTKKVDEKGEEVIIKEADVEIYTRKVNTTTHVRFMQVGDMFGGYGTIIEPLNDDNTLVTEDDYGSTYYIKITNIEEIPSLYKGGLVF